MTKSNGKPATRAELCENGAVTIEEACEFLSVGRSVVYELMRSGELPWTKVGRHRKIPRVALRMYLEQNLVAEGATS